MCKIKVDDKVLLQYTALKGRHKIQGRWENTIYEVIEQPIGKMPAFKVKSMEGNGVLWHNHQYINRHTN